PLLPEGGRGRQRAGQGGNRQPGVGAQREVYPLQFPLLIGQDFLRRDGRPACCDRATVRLPSGNVPAPHRAVERVGRGPQAFVGASRPVSRVVTRAAAITRRVRDLVEPIAASGGRRVRPQVLLARPII